MNLLVMLCMFADDQSKLQTFAAYVAISSAPSVVVNYVRGKTFCAIMI